MSRRLETVAASAREVTSRLGTRLKALTYLNKWLILSSLIGVIAGLGAALFYEALSLSTHLFLGVVAGYHVPAPAGEGNAVGSLHYARAWAIPLVVTVGGLLAGLLVFTWAPEAEGHGTDAAIDAVHYNPRGIRLRAVVIKLVASALTIGSGGSGGREGPTAQISAGFGSLLARVFDLTPEDGRIAVSVGIGSGIGAIFGAPLGGAVLSADIVYRDDFESSALIPGIFASVVAYAVFGAFYGYKPLFALSGGYRFEPIQLAWFAIVGVLAGGIGLLYAKSFYGVVRLSARLPFSRKLRPALGALLVGLLALWLPEVLGTGYGWVQKGLSDDLLHTPLYIILLLPFARILATSLSIGTGGSGGVFGPGMVVGSFTGLAVWRVLAPIAPGVGHDPAPFVVVGMMAVFGGISRAPLAVMIMVAEMTGSISVLPAAMVAVAISAFIVGRTDDTIYRSQLRSRAESPAGRLQSAMPLAAALDVASLAQEPRVVLKEGTPAHTAVSELQAAAVPGAPVVDEHELYRGVVDVRVLAEMSKQDPNEVIDRAIDVTATTVSDSARFATALDALSQAGGHWVTVTDRKRHVVGVLSMSDVVAGYRRALITSLGQLSEVATNAVIVEERVGRDSPLVGVPLRDAQLPPGSVVLSIQRGEELLSAGGSTMLATGDIVNTLTQEESRTEVRRLIRGVDSPETSRDEQGGQLV
jgi:H+/Cl- antiporter ClcA/CBS domain-containing protein